MGFEPFCDRCQQRVIHSVGYPRPRSEDIQRGRWEVECGLCSRCWDEVHPYIFELDHDPFGRDTYPFGRGTYLGTQPF